MVRLYNGKFKLLLCVPLIVLLATSGAFAQGRVSRGKPANTGQVAVYTVVGNSAPVCLNLAQLDASGALLTFSSYYIGALATKQIAGPSITGYVTGVFAISEVGSPNPGTACAIFPAAFLTDPTREPKIFEQIVGGDGPAVTVNQLNATLALATANCVQSQNQTATNNNNQTNIGTASGTGSKVFNTGANVNIPVTSQVQAQICVPANFVSSNQLNFADVNSFVVFGFEELSFQPVTGAILTSLLGNCTASTMGNLAGASFTLTCRPPTTGTFSDQSFH